LKSPKNTNVLEVLCEEIKLFGINSIYQKKSYVFELSTHKLPTFEIFIGCYEIISEDKLIADLTKLANVGLGLEQMKNGCLSRHSILRMVHNRDDKVRSYVNLLINAKDQLSINYLTWLLSNLTMKDLGAHEELVKNSKFAKLLNSIKKERQFTNFKKPVLN
jgi:hypothetical protein